MKLQDFSSFQPFESLRTRMGATRLGTFELGMAGPKITHAESEKLDSVGLDIEDLDQLRPLPDGTLAFKNYRVIVHIRDVNRLGVGAAEEDRLPRFHVSNCSTLQEMRANNRIGRYVVATRNDGKFVLNLKPDGRNWKQQLRKLLVCKNCLNHLRYDGFSYDLPSDTRNRIFAAFTIREFFDRYPKTPIYEPPADLDIGANLNEYPDGWREKSVLLRQAANWKCQNPGCGINLANYRRFLDVHHKNGLKFDTADENLEVLCVKCHAAQYGHGHMKRDPRYTAFLHLRHSGRLS